MSRVARDGLARAAITTLWSGHHVVPLFNPFSILILCLVLSPQAVESELSSWPVPLVVNPTSDLALSIVD
jgi:hypothetical protein